VLPIYFYTTETPTRVPRQRVPRVALAAACRLARPQTAFAREANEPRNAVTEFGFVTIDSLSLWIFLWIFGGLGYVALTLTGLGSPKGHRLVLGS
jgi:hypothetical protein